MTVQVKGPSTFATQGMVPNAILMAIITSVLSTDPLKLRSQAFWAQTDGAKPIKQAASAAKIRLRASVRFGDPHELETTSCENTKDIIARNPCKAEIV